MPEFELVKADTQEYDSLLSGLMKASFAGSPAATVFHRADYLGAAVDHYDIFFIKKGHSVRAGLSVVKDRAGRLAIDDLVIHCGPWFCIPEDTKPVRALAERFRILEFLSEVLAKQYGKVALALHPDITDVRPFLWYNYHADSASPRYQIDIRYTSFLQVDASFVSEEDLFRRMDTLRQRHLRESKKNALEVFFRFEIDYFLSLYGEMMGAQGEQVSKDKLQRMGRLLTFLQEAGKLFPVHVRQPDSKSSYIVLMVHEGQTAWYLFGAGTVGRKERYLGTRAFYEAFLNSRKHGIQYIDMEGVNSPKRGAFKLSFGGDLRPYYEVLLP